MISDRFLIENLLKLKYRIIRIANGPVIQKSEKKGIVLAIRNIAAGTMNVNVPDVSMVAKNGTNEAEMDATSIMDTIPAVEPTET